MARLPLVAVLLWLAVLVASCAEDVGLIDRTQPGALHKSVLQGEWYLRRTVIDAPYTAGFTFVGEADDLERVRWQINEDHLIAYRAYDFIAGTDRDHSRRGMPGQLGSAGESGQPVAIYKILKHFDVKRGYSPATGEQDNVLAENDADRPWYQRDYLRVDWSANLVPGKGFEFTVDTIQTEPVQFAITDPADPDSFTLGQRDSKSPVGWRDTRDPVAIREAHSADYFDVVSKIYATPASYGGWDEEGPWSVPVCWFYGNEDCKPAEVTIRTSFMKIDAKDDYEPMDYPDNQLARDEQGGVIKTRVLADGSVARDPDGEPVRIPFFDKFGYFRAERYGYDALHGEVESARRLLIGRWNLWQQSSGADGKPLAYSARKTKPIVYYKSIGFPKELEAQTQQIASQWDGAFRRTVAALQGKDPKDVEPLYVIRENTYHADAGGKVTDRGQRQGDLRYSMLYYVSKPTRAGLLGYGPSAIDPTTGQIIQATANVYGAAHKVLATTARDILRLVRGELDPEDFGLGHATEAEVQAALHTFAPGQSSKPKTTGAAGAAGQTFASDPMALPERLPGSAAHQQALQEAADFAQRVTSRAKQKEVVALKKSALAERPGWPEARLGMIEGSPLMSLLVNRQIALAHGDPALREALSQSPPGAAMPALTPAQKEALSPRYWSPRSAWQRHLERRKDLAKNTIQLAEFSDDAVMGIAEQLKDQPIEVVWQKIFEAVFRSTAEHEVGHTLGLRHNFEGSYDALNFHDAYWDLRGEAGKPLEDPTPAQRSAGMNDFRYSSIMDYAQRFHSDIKGLGKYDYAAIAFGYGGLVETFADPPVDSLIKTPPSYSPYKAAEVDGYNVFAPFYQDPLRAALHHSLRHYTQIPKMMGGLAAMRGRNLVPYQSVIDELTGKGSTADQPAKRSLWEVPYRFCSDEYVEGTPSCNMFDAGADSYEVVRAGFDQWRDHYVLQAFRRDRVQFVIQDYEERIRYRTFLPAALQYQNWVFWQYDPETRLNPGVLWDWLTFDPAVAKKLGLDAKPWEQAQNAGLPMTAAVKEGFEQLANVLAVPEPGQYCLDKDTGLFRQFSYATKTAANVSLPQCATPQGCEGDQDCADLVIPLGVGRLFETDYDQTTGYYFFERLRHIGSFYDKVMALDILTDPSTYFIGVDSSQPVHSYILSMGLYFAKELNGLFGGLSAGRHDVLGWVRGSDGKLQRRNWADLQAGEAQRKLPAIEAPGMFILRNYAIFYGMAWLSADWDQTFLDSSQIFLQGSGDGFTPKPGATVATYTHEANGRTYQSVKMADGTLFSPGWEMVHAAAALADRVKANPAAWPPWMLDESVQMMEIVRGMYDIFGKAVF